MTDRVVRRDADGLCTLTLNRPSKLNALDVHSFLALNAHLDDLERQTDEVGCVVLRGEGRAFCTGMDLAAVGREGDAPCFKPGVIERLARLPQPVIVAVHGACYTGGLELALTGDFIVADASARFADTHGKWGLVATWGVFQRLPRRIGPGAARRMMMTSCVVDGAEAKQIGLADLLAPEGMLEDVTRTLTAEVLANSWHVNFAAKRFMRETDGMGIHDALSYERQNYPGLAADHRGRIARFDER